jgi:hypothetical protein
MTQIVYNGLPKFLGRLLYVYLHPLLGADEFSWDTLPSLQHFGGKRGVLKL